jgi:outer membrane receptor for ferrienterochelin and colicins
VTDHTDYDRFHSFFAKTAVQDFTLEAAYSSRTKGIPTGAFSTDFNDPANKTVDTRGYADLRYDHNLGRQTDLTARIFYDYYEYTGDYAAAVGALNKDWGYAEWWGGEARLSTRLFDLHRIIGGAEFTYNNRMDQQNYDNFAPYASYLDDKRRSQIWAFYGQDEFTVFKQLTLTIGGRYDHYDTFGGAKNPRLALIYTPVEKSVFKLLYGTAFRAPSPFELYYQSSTNVSNPDLLPEKIKTYEVVYEQYFGDRFRATATGFYYKISNLINQTDTFPGSGVTVFENLEKVESRGLELELENKWDNGVEGRISCTLQRTNDMQTNETLSNSPEQLAKLTIAVPLVRDKIFAGLEEQYMSKRKTIASGYTRDFYLSNLTLYSRRIMKGFELSASIYNLFDVKYGDPVSADFKQQTILQDGRTYRLKLTYAF